MAATQLSSHLTVWTENSPQTPELQTGDRAKIAESLDRIGVRFERWDPSPAPAPGSTQDDVIAAFGDQVEKVNSDEGFTFVDVAQLHPDDDDPEWPTKAAAARAKFLDEHAHDDDEVRFFVDGSGVFYLHVDGLVYGMLCVAGDLLSVPRNTTHWFDFGERPSFTAIRFFHDDDGWVGNFTGNDISKRFPTHDDLVTAASAASSAT